MNSSIVCMSMRSPFRHSKYLQKIWKIHWQSYSIRSRIKLENIPQEENEGMEWNIMETFSWLREVAPCFPVDGSKIKIIHEPAVFYSTLVDKCRKAEKRITIASLYLGTGKLEGDLVKAIKASIDSTNGNVKINILLDFMRGSRGKINSRTMLLPLVDEKSNKNCKLYFYHTPQLRGITKAVIPHRFNELIGLQHMKLYICDDSLIISGQVEAKIEKKNERELIEKHFYRANLSNDYFTNRQDRYFLIENCKELCDFYDELVQRVSEFSFQLMPGNIMSYHSKSPYHPLQSNSKKFSEAVRKRIQSLSLTTSNTATNTDLDTHIYPLIQMGPLGIYQDSKVTLHLLKTAPAGALLRIATSYFNLTSDYQNAMLKDCQATCDILTAHPTANGFFGAKGVAGGIPAAYTLIEKSFYTKIDKRDIHDRIILREFTHSGWTYHAKGLWYTLPDHQRPSLTLIGSSNFGYRSVKRDLESQIAIVTKNRKLQDALEEEHTRLYEKSKTVTAQTFNQVDRIPPVWVCAVATLFRYYF